MPGLDEGLKFRRIGHLWAEDTFWNSVTWISCRANFGQVSLSQAKTWDLTGIFVMLHYSDLCRLWSVRNSLADIFV